MTNTNPYQRFAASNHLGMSYFSEEEEKCILMRLGMRPVSERTNGNNTETGIDAKEQPPMFSARLGMSYISEEEGKGMLMRLGMGKFISKE